MTKDDQYTEKKMQVNEGITFEWKIWNNFSESIKAWSGKKNNSRLSFFLTVEIRHIFCLILLGEDELKGLEIKK